MHARQITKRKHPLLVKYSLKDSPHLTIETNLSCNIKCRSCYNINNSYLKDFNLICEEIDAGIKKRKLQSLTLIGGEPTLHPDLVRIIAYIKRKGIHCQMLTNGIRFLEDKQDHLLDSLLAAGLDKILLHVDEGQSEIHNDLHSVIRILFDKFEKRKIFFSLSTTVFQDTQNLLAAKIKTFASYRYFDGILALLVRNCEESIQPGFDASALPVMEKEYEGIREELGIEPLAYFPTSLDDEDLSWLFYFFYINARTGKIFSRSRTLISLFFKTYYFLFRRAAFGLSFRGATFYLVFIFSSLMEIFINPLRIYALIRLTLGSRFLSSLRIHTLVIQNPPQYHSDKQQFHICYHCPDATIRNGLLTPLCLADLINPLPEMPSNRLVSEGVYRTVYEHMGELE